MVYSFESFCRKVKDEFSESIKYIVMGNKYGNNIIYVMLWMLVNYYLIFLIRNLTLYILIFILVFIIFLLVLKNQRVGIGLNKDRLLYVRFNVFYKAKEIYGINLDDIKYLDVKKFLGTNYVNLSFINKDGKFVKLKFFYKKYIVGLSVSEQHSNGIMITKRLKEIQKVLDKGDF